MNAGARLLCTSDGVCVTICLVLLCGGRYGLGGGVLRIEFGRSRTSEGSSGGTILLFHIISDRPPKQPLFFPPRGLGWRMHLGVEVTV